MKTHQIQIDPRLRLRVSLHYLEPRRPISSIGVLFIHGASFPTMLASGFQFKPGDSWIHFMANQGVFSCGLDFLGFGNSSRPNRQLGVEMHEKPLVRADEAAHQIALAANYIKKEFHVAKLHIVAHSWGTIPAATFAASIPRHVKSLTLFGPIVPIRGSTSKPVHNNWWSITAVQRLEQLYYKDILPTGTVLLEASVTQRWAKEFALSNPDTKGNPLLPTQIPAGPVADIKAAHAGLYPYMHSELKVPVFVIYGNYDNQVNDKSAGNFIRKFKNSPLKWCTAIDNGSHVLHLEKNRWSLYEAVNSFIRTIEK